jgi:hypothetical protein
MWLEINICNTADVPSEPYSPCSHTIKYLLLFIHTLLKQKLCNGMCNFVTRVCKILNYRKCEIQTVRLTETCLLLHANETVFLAGSLLSSIQCQPLSLTTCQTGFFNQLCSSLL